MKYFYCLSTVLILIMLGTSAALTQTEKQQSWLLQFAEEQEKIATEERAKAESIAIKNKMPIRIESPDGTIMELQRFENGMPVYYITESNLNAAKTISTDKVWPGGSGGFSLTGVTDTVGEWDGGKVRGTHQELTGRVIFGDGASTLSDHSTHVAGTMIATGVDAAAKGMSYQGRLKAYDWNNDASEMATAAVNRLRVSNHSYGQITGWRWSYYNDNRWYWFGTPSISPVEDYGFGYYSTRARDWDNIMVNAPNYLIVKSAGNDRGEGPSGTVEHYVSDGGGGWTLVTAPRNLDGGPLGYDCISYYSTAKNILTVGAVKIIPGGWSGAGSVIMSDFSGWGPTDDGRIKPDIVGAGVGLKSSISTSDIAYDTYDGTSMSSPNITGSIGLILQHQRNLYGGNFPMRSSTVKGLLIHNADEAGSFEGPDYKFGWGLMNTLKTVRLMTTNKTSINNFYVKEMTLTNGDSITISIPGKASQPLRATICWIDPAGTTPPVSLNPPNLMLINDLDMRINKEDVIYYPWVLDPSNPAAAATKGDNFRDNVEQIVIPSPVNGLYTLKIKHKGTLSGGSQDVSIIISGGQPLVVSYPVGGEILPIGSTQTIKWAASGFSGNVKIELSRNGGTTYEVLFGNTTNDGEEQWVVSGASTTQARVRITSLDTPEIVDVSNSNFAIRQPTLVLSYPNGGEIFHAGDNITITWSTTYLQDFVKIELSRDGGSTFETLFGSTPNDGSESWIVTGPRTQQVIMKITSLIVPTLFDISNNIFTIKTPFIELLFPNDWVGLVEGNNYEIRWESYLASDNLHILISRYPSKDVDTLFSNTPNDGSEFWTATGPLTPTAKIQIVDTQNPLLSGGNNNEITIGIMDSVFYKSGWSMISLPYLMAENRRSELFQNGESNAFVYIPDSGYESTNILYKMKGYWLKFLTSGFQPFIGVPNDSDSVPVFTGWNQIGGLSVPIPIQNISTEPVDIIRSEIYGYDRVYSAVDTLQPGKSYWVKVKIDGLLILSNTFKK